MKGQYDDNYVSRRHECSNKTDAHTGSSMILRPVLQNYYACCSWNAAEALYFKSDYHLILKWWDIIIMYRLVICVYLLEKKLTLSSCAFSITHKHKCSCCNFLIEFKSCSSSIKVALPMLTMTGFTSVPFYALHFDHIPTSAFLHTSSVTCTCTCQHYHDSPRVQHWDTCNTQPYRALSHHTRTTAYRYK